MRQRAAACRDVRSAPCRIPAGTFRTVTNDTNHYVNLHLSEDARSLVSLVSRTTASIDVRAATGGAETRITESREPIRGFAWTNEGGVLYPRGNQLVVRGSDGRERIVLESDVNSPPANPEVCPGSGQIWASRLKRVSRSESAAKSAGRILRATGRVRRVSRAQYTWPIAAAAMMPSIS
jgi:hypothetical protein